MMTVEEIMWCATHRSVATYYQAEQDRPRCDWCLYDERSHGGMTTQSPCRWEWRLLVNTEGMHR